MLCNIPWVNPTCHPTYSPTWNRTWPLGVIERNLGLFKVCIFKYSVEFVVILNVLSFGARKYVTRGYVWDNVISLAFEFI